MKIIPEDKLFKDVPHAYEVHLNARESVLRVLGNKGFKVGVEIGVQYGQNAERLLDYNAVGTLYGIDPYLTEIGTVTPLNDGIRDNEVYGFALGKLDRFGDRYIHIKKISNEALFDIDGQIDCIYIDGGKRKNQIYDDISYWYPKIRVGGIMVGHDYEHSSYPYITRLVNEYFQEKINVEEGGVWWMQRTNTLFRHHTEKVSIVTPFYNTTRYAQELISMVDDIRIGEMIILDDCSNESEYESLCQQINNHPKIRVLRNEENLGEFKTRVKATRYASNKWVIFLDGDNILTLEYLDAIFNIPKWREDVIYAPDFGRHHHIDYREYDGSYINKTNAKRYISKPYLFNMFLNTGNYFMDKKSYLQLAEPNQEINKYSYGDIYFNGLWLEAGKSIFVVPGMEYVHRIRKDSAWKEHSEEMQPVVDAVINKLR
jgi:hypothetical protein